MKVELALARFAWHSRFAEGAPQLMNTRSIKDSLAKAVNRAQTGCAGCSLAGVGCLLVFVLFLSANALLIVLLGSEVPGRVVRVGPDPHQGVELRYSYTVNGRTYNASTRVSEREAMQLPSGKPLRVRVFRWTAGLGAFVIGYGPPPLATTAGLGFLALPVLLIVWVVIKTSFFPGESPMTMILSKMRQLAEAPPQKKEKENS